MFWLLIIPIITIIGLYFLVPHKMVWWEYVVPVGTSLIAIFLANFVCDKVMSWDTEWHGGICQKAVWNEHWTEQYTVTVNDYCTNEKGETYVCGSHEEIRHTYHPDYYVLTDSNGYEVSINYEHYKWLSQYWNNEKKEKPWRSGQSSWGDGRRFTTVVDPTQKPLPCFTSHRYENRVAHSHSVFNFRDINKEEKQKYGLFDYPKIYNFHYQNSILGWNDSKAEDLLTMANAKLGSVKQMRMFILVFKNQPLNAGLAQQMLWKNGNKNEVIVCIGTDSSGSISWVFPFAWDNERLLVDLREDIASMQKLDMVKVVDKTIELCQRGFRRKSFKEFEYIKLEPPLWAKFLSFLFVLGVNIGVAYIVVMNNIDSE